MVFIQHLVGPKGLRGMGRGPRGGSSVGWAVLLATLSLSARAVIFYCVVRHPEWVLFGKAVSKLLSWLGRGICNIKLV